VEDSKMATKKTKSADTAPVTSGESSIEQRKAAAKQAIQMLEKTYGKGVVQSLGSSEKIACDSISTGILPLDVAIGVRGLPRGRITEIYGPESAGKTLIALQTASEVQKNGGLVAYVDVEHALNIDFARRIGIDVDALLVSQPDSGEEALEVAEALIRSGGIDLVVIDSVAALVTQSEIDGDMGDNHVGVLARLMSQGLKKLNAAISKTNTMVIFINQIREKVGVVYGNPETTPGGRALKFYASVRLDVRKKEPIKRGSEIVGNRVKVKVVKNKVAPPFKECEFDLMFDSGASKSGSLVDMATDLDILQKSGSWFSYNGSKVGQGRDAAKVWVEQNPDIYNEIQEKIYAAMEKKAAEKTDSSSNSVPSIPDNLDIPPVADMNGADDDFESFDFVG
jgi:recombination protein RecA